MFPLQPDPNQYNAVITASLPISKSGGVDDGVSSSSCSGSTIWWSEKRDFWLKGDDEGALEVEKTDVQRGNLCSLAGVLGGVGQMLSVGGTEKTRGVEESDSLLMSMTWMGAEWLRRFT